MPRERTTKKAAMPDFEKEFDALVGTKEGTARILGFARLLCQLIDASVAHGDTWVNIGTTRDKTLANITLHEGSSTTYATGANLDELLRTAESL